MINETNKIVIFFFIINAISLDLLISLRFIYSFTLFIESLIIIISNAFSEVLKIN